MVRVACPFKSMVDAVLRNYGVESRRRRGFTGTSDRLDVVRNAILIRTPSTKTQINAKTSPS